MSTKPNQGKNPDQDGYGGYTGYQPRKPADDPYGAYSRPSGDQQGGTAGQQGDPNYVYGQQQTYRSSGGSSSASSGQQQQQQSKAYQPPSSVTGRSYDSSGQASTGLQPNHAAALSYLGLWLTGLFFLFWGRKNRLVRFSAAQSIVLFLPLMIIYIILTAIIGFIANIPIIGLLAPLLFTAVLVVIVMPAILVWLFLIIMALLGREVKLPYVAEYAERLYNLFSPRQKKTGN